MTRHTLSPHPAVCSWCEQEFTITLKAQLIARNAGRNVYCSKKCSSAVRYRSDIHLLGPCPECGQMFRSQTKSKIFCSMKCFTDSPELRERLQSYNNAKKTPPKACPQCGIEFQKKNRKFCSKLCWRKYFAERFDRFIANPEKIALPQNFDEFMLQEELPCLFENCEWVGPNLSQHVNSVHGVTAEKFRELAGFNKRTGLVGAEEHKRQSQRMKQMIADGIITTDPSLLLSLPRKGSPTRLEGKEHLKKSMALRRSQETERPRTPCLQCGVPIEQPVTGLRKYCSTKCRSKYYQEKTRAELRCSHCGETFWGLYHQVMRARKELPVCCSDHCRNQRNIVFAIEGRKKKSLKN